MKITRLETIHVKPRWLFLKMHTDGGIVGLGEPILEGRAQTVAAAVQEIGRYLIGQDPPPFDQRPVAQGKPGAAAIRFPFWL